MGYLFDMHVHTSETSRCGEVCAADVVKRYIDLGYDGICITDHMNKSTAKKFPGTKEEFANGFLKGYRAAKEAAGDKLKIILGMEIRFLENDNDYLVFGFDEDFVKEYTLYNFETLEDFRPFALEHKLTVFQAHPFREGMTVIDWELVDGIEVYNGHGGHDSANDIALAWAKKRNKRMSSGSDFHRETGMESGGIYFDEFPENSFDVAKMLIENKYKLKIGD